MKKLLVFLLILLGYSTTNSLANFKLTSPNGGEKFVAGIDTLITWDGILPADTVKLEYSIDSGLNWKLITDYATGLQYIWKDVPKPTSDECLIKITRKINYDTTIAEVKIGNQIWMQLNLEVDHYCNGDSIPYVWDPNLWSGLKTGAWCKAKPDPKMGAIYGYVYNAYAVNDPRGLAPLGWHVASNEEWKELENYLGGPAVAGGKLKSTGTIEAGDGLWYFPNTGATNESGFSALPASYTIDNSKYGLGRHTTWWTSTLLDDMNNFFKMLRYSDAVINTYGGGYGGICSVRCIKDVTSVISGLFSIVEPQGLAKNIDMKKSLVATPKDSTITNFVYNSGTYKFQVDSIYFRGPDASAFSITNGLPKYTLEPKEGRNTEFRFTPSRVGIHTAEIVIIAKTGTLIQTIQGEGIKINPEIQTTPAIFPVLACGQTNSTKITIINPSNNILKIYELNIKGANSDEFTTTEKLPITIDPTSQKNITITFKPKSIGQKNADLEIVSNADPDSTLIIPLNAIKDSVNISFVESKIDLGYLCPNEEKVSMVYIENIGTLASRGILSSSPKIIINEKEFYLSVNESKVIGFKYKGTNIEGDIDEIITLSDTICHSFKMIHIIGKVVIPQIEAKDISISALVNEAKQAAITIHNTGERDVTITNPPVLIPSLTWVGNQFPATVKAKDSTKFLIEFLPFDIQSFGLQITFFADECNISQDVNIQLIAEIPPPKLTVAILNDSAYAGQVRRLKLMMSNINPEEIAAIAPSFSAKIRFQKTILTPLKKADRIIVNDSMYMNVKGRFEDSYNLAQLLVTAGLGNVEETSIDIVEFNLTGETGNIINSDIEIEKQSGLFKLLGICREGGTRLINPTGKAEILSIIPNPASDDVEINVNLIEDGYSTLSVYNVNGLKLREFKFDDGIGLKSIEINAREFDNGLYFIKLQTPTVIENKKLMIVK